MSPSTFKGQVDLFKLSQQLQQAGWDAFASDIAGELAARREQPKGQGVWNLVIDRSGRWRFTATRDIGQTDRRELIRRGQAFRLRNEKHQVLTIAGRLHSPNDMTEVLEELAQLAFEDADHSEPAAEGPLAWNENALHPLEQTHL